MTSPHRSSGFFQVIRRTISSVDSPDPYLLRWEWNTPWFTVKLHRFLRSDLAPLHDHPWWFLSFILWGGYTEYLARNPSETAYPKKIRRWPFSVAFRRATDRHRVDIGDRKNVWTLCLTGPRRREWAFYPMTKWHEPIRVPWRVAVKLGERVVQEMVDEGHREAGFAGYNRTLIEIEDMVYAAEASAKGDGSSANGR